ncbi:alpha/beta fold hydrolase [Alkalicoccobacillus murimartini]|uniref:Pimeloyl-ACP methyl ester carboxylesterase n=1 Tax=Alkalicoccobacillus murimartini TaxID=171685 RepID=A0ABT9YP15_9BACI|nr:alpha/beta hydrolase [Alkalicoccobacillus murimartini]MDQ0208769.1 pimeloyl-ACP methyl ester carboxylesterase [Alkalicoccobacillus murimartini]
MTKSKFLRHWAGNLKMESREQLHHIKCPTLILHGEQDKMVARQQQILSTSIPHSLFQPIKHADHLTNRDNPEDVTKAIHTFVKELTPYA